MRIVISEFISLDGVVQAPGGPDEDIDGGFAHGGWSHPFFDPEVMGDASSPTTARCARSSWSPRSPAARACTCAPTGRSPRGRSGRRRRSRRPDGGIAVLVGDDELGKRHARPLDPSQWTSCLF